MLSDLGAVLVETEIERAIRAAQIEALKWAAEQTLGAADKLDNPYYCAILEKISELKGEK